MLSFGTLLHYYYSDAKNSILLLNINLFYFYFHNSATRSVLDDSGSCAVQQMHHAHVTCAADGNYTARQCSGGPRVMCRCVDTLTGIRLLTSHAVPERTKEELNCSAEVLRGERAHARLLSRRAIFKKSPVHVLFFHKIPMKGMHDFTMNKYTTGLK